MTMSEMKNMAKDAFALVAFCTVTIGASCGGAVIGGYLYDEFAAPVSVPQSVAEVSRYDCFRDYCIKVPEDELDDRLAAIQADPAAYIRKRQNQDREMAMLMGFILPPGLMALALMAAIDRRPPGPRP